MSAWPLSAISDNLQRSKTASYSITSSARASSGSGNCDAKRLRSLEIEEHLDLGGLLNREVGGFFALEDAAGIDAGQAVGLGDAAAVAREPAGGNEPRP